MAFISIRGWLTPIRQLIDLDFAFFRSSAVFGAFLFLGTFGLGALRAYVPNLALLTILATIVLDVVSRLLVRPMY